MSKTPATHLAEFIIHHGKTHSPARIMYSAFKELETSDECDTPPDEVMAFLDELRLALSEAVQNEA